MLLSHCHYNCCLSGLCHGQFLVQSKPIVSLFWNNLERAVVEKSEKGGASWIYSLDAPPFFVAGIALGSDKVEIVECMQNIR